MENYIELVGSLAATLITIAFFPQVFKVYKTKSTKDISTAMYIILCTAMSLWIIYGSVLKLYPLLISNCITLTLSASVLVMKLAWGNKEG